MKNEILEKEISLKELEILKFELVNLTSEFNIFSILDSCNYQESPFSSTENQYSLLAGIDCSYKIDSSTNNINDIDLFLETHFGQWIFCHFNYDIKNSIEKSLESKNIDLIQFPDFTLFIPRTFIGVQNNKCYYYGEMDLLKQLSFFGNENVKTIYKNEYTKETKLAFTLADEYKKVFNDLSNHIQYGDIYEINFCIPFILKNIKINPAALWLEMKKKSPAPFAALYKCNNSWLLCNSPERFIKKENDRIISQPIKGTAPRNINPSLDIITERDLSENEKEKSENIMIVDLVRNDLSKISKRNSVKVEELCGIYKFPQVFQMISTISAEIKEGVGFTNILKAMFPMGSMTGAPKVKAMELIEKNENFKRGLFSGAVGYISPNGNFDFNVVIRSILYNEKNNIALIPAGSAITSGSTAEAEYKECILKASANLKLLGFSNIIDDPELSLSK